MDNALNELLRHPGIWRAGARQQQTGLEHLPSGFPELDDALPGRGWPVGALTEILHGHSGIGELRLLMPALARLSRQGKWIALIAPPYIPYAPALAGYGLDLSRVLLIHPGNRTDALWAVEQALRAGTCGAVLAWPSRVDDSSLRRLQLAAEAGRTLGLIFRRQGKAAGVSPAAVRLQLEHRDGSAVVNLLKCRGGGTKREIIVDLAVGYRAEKPRPEATRTPTDAHPSPAGPEWPAGNRIPGRERQSGRAFRAATLPADRPAPPPRTRRGTRSRHFPSGRRRAAQMDLPLAPPPPAPRPQATLGTTAGAPDKSAGRLAWLWDKIR
ncbi:MAG: translesion DNA synthesis-associated protein ImuA [Ectothiorhodospiraceae bacterium]|jgi:cell division inhibitor SulA/protein ImuA